MRVIIVREDNFVSVDGIGYSGLNLSFLPKEVAAVQWYGSHGEVEVRGERIANEAIQTLANFKPALDAWHARHAEVTAPPTSEELIERIWFYIKAERDRRTQTGGFQVGDYWFHSDQFSRTQQLGLVQLGEAIPAGLQWKTMSGEFVTMTPELARQVLEAAATQEQRIFAVAEQHRVAMEASAEPWNYDYSSGWPLTYDEATHS